MANKDTKTKKPLKRTLKAHKKKVNGKPTVSRGILRLAPSKKRVCPYCS